VTNVAGVFLRPFRVFSANLVPAELGGDPDARVATACEVIAECDFEGVRLLITRVGGVFAEAGPLLPTPESSVQQRMKDRAAIAAAINALIYELAGVGEWAEPVAWHDFADAVLDDGSITVRSGPPDVVGVMSTVRDTGQWLGVA